MCKFGYVMDGNIGASVVNGFVYIFGKSNVDVNVCVNEYTLLYTHSIDIDWCIQHT